jgi:hypothetical protein
MGIDRDDGGHEGENLAIQAEHRAIVVERGRLFEIADMRADNRLAPSRIRAKSPSVRPPWPAWAGRSEKGKRERRGRIAPRRIGTGAPPSSSATTLSSSRFTMARSCIRKASAIPARRRRASSLSIACGSSLRLPEVMTSGPPKASSRR